MDEKWKDGTPIFEPDPNPRTISPFDEARNKILQGKRPDQLTQEDLAELYANSGTESDEKIKAEGEGRLTTTYPDKAFFEGSKTPPAKPWDEKKAWEEYRRQPRVPWDGRGATFKGNDINEKWAKAPGPWTAEEWERASRQERMAMYNMTEGRNKPYIDFRKWDEIEKGFRK